MPSASSIHSAWHLLDIPNMRTFIPLVILNRLVYIKLTIMFIVNVILMHSLHNQCVPSADTFFFLETEEKSLLRLHPSWCAVEQSRLTATSASQVQAILLPQPPK